MKYLNLNNTETKEVLYAAEYDGTELAPDGVGLLWEYDKWRYDTQAANLGGSWAVYCGDEEFAWPTESTE